jgi:TolB-like protein/class 3 adenylate cyclase/Flp pilus assembly protein TadD
MFTDMVGYTALGQKNESLSLALLDEQRKLIRPILNRHNGREVKTMGDAFLVEFPSALDAVRCGYDIQRTTRELNISLPEERRVHIRIGVHLGDVVESGGDISGDAVNVASRIEPLADDGGVCLTRQVFDHVQNKFELPMTSLGVRPLKNVSTPPELYKMVMPWQEEKLVPSIELDLKRVAVLPFVNVSPDPNDEYFADGLTDELIDRLAQIKGLEVIARTSIMTYKKKEKKAAEIGKELKAGVLVEGSVRKAGNRIRVTAQIINANTEAHLWSSKYDENLEDVFAIQTDIAEKVAQSLTIKLLPNERKEIGKKTTDNPAVYVICLKGRYYWNERRKDDNERALRYYEAAIRLDPKCALAYSGISDCYHTAGDYNWLMPRDAYPKTREYATKALEIDPDLAEAHASLGAEYMHYEWKWREAEEEFMKATTLRPSYSFAHQAYSALLEILGRFEEAHERIKRAYELDPLSKAIAAQYGRVLSEMGRNEEAISQLQRVTEANPDFPTAHLFLGFAYHRVSRNQEAVSELIKAAALSDDDPRFRADLAFLLALTGRNDEAKTILGELKEASAKTYVSSAQMASICHALGESDEAFELLEKAYTEKCSDLADIRTSPEMSGLRRDARWTSLEERMGFPH